MLSINKKNILWVLGSIVLGALGSGLWDLAVKPMFTFISEFLIDSVLSTFSVVQNYIYEEIASLNREITGRILLAFLMGSLMGVVTSIVIRFFRHTDNNLTVAKNSFSPSRFHVATFGAFVLAFTLLTTSKTGYVLTKQNNYLQLNRIILPYINEVERLKLDSEFSLIKSTDEYNALIEKMRVIAEKNNIDLPKHLK